MRLVMRACASPGWVGSGSFGAIERPQRAQRAESPYKSASAAAAGSLSGAACLPASAGRRLRRRVTKALSTAPDEAYKSEDRWHSNPALLPK